MRARVLLVYPPSRTQVHGSCPAALTMLAAVLEAAGHEVHLLDANACAHRRTRAEIVAHATKLRPDVVGVTLVTPLVREAYRLAADLRPLGAKLLAGGPHATLLPLEPLEHGFDATVVGEGEPTIVEAVEALLGERPKSHVEGLVYRDDDGSLRASSPRAPVADLDALPTPARHLVDAKEYGGAPSGELHMNVFSSRGCPARCSYCAGGLFGRRFRFRSASSIVAEMTDVHARFGTRNFHFMDDAMTMNRPRVLELCERLEGSGLTWSVMTRVDRVDAELLATLRRGGCVQIDYGIESGDPETLKRIHKPHTIEMVRRVVPMTAAAGIKPYVFFILGFPWDTPERIDRTRELMIELSPHVARFDPAIASVLIPFPATELYEQNKDRFGFADWWLTETRCYDAPDRRRHAFFEKEAFPRGAVLDADFFRYSPEVRRKILDVFELMWRHNLRASGAGTAELTLKPLLFDLSRRLHEISPRLESRVFDGIEEARRALGPLARWAVSSIADEAA